MFVNIPANGIQPTGAIVWNGVTTAVTSRYRAGRPIEIRQARSFGVFIDAGFVAGWNTLDQAITCAERYGSHVASPRPDVKFTAAWDPAEAEVTVVCDRRAGICGPAGSYPATSLVEAAEKVFGAGYLVTGNWEVCESGAYWVDLSPMFDA